MKKLPGESDEQLRRRHVETACPPLAHLPSLEQMQAEIQQLQTIGQWLKEYSLFMGSFNSHIEDRCFFVSRN